MMFGIGRGMARGGLALAGLLVLAGCYEDGYGYGGLSVGTGGGYYGYDDPYYRSGYGYGWYDGFYYPGSGYWVYDRGGNRHRWNDGQRRYWEARRDRRQDWRDDRREVRRDRRDDRRDWREDRRDDRQDWRADRRDDRRDWRQDRRDDRREAVRDNRGDRRDGVRNEAASRWQNRVQQQQQQQPAVRPQATPRPSFANPGGSGGPHMERRGAPRAEARQGQRPGRQGNPAMRRDRDNR
jgi:hypothetical protein